jgi:segregation and condensation protein B
MKIVTTPMCQDILRLAGVFEYDLISQVNYRDADIAFILSETKIDNNSGIEFVKLRLNTFSQIEQSIQLVSNIIGTEPIDEYLNYNFNNNINTPHRQIRVKVYANFLRDIAQDIGFSLAEEDDYDFMIYPDYLKKKLQEEIDSAGEKAIELPSHKNAPLNPIKRAEMRYKILEKIICMKH